jgi:adenylate cyclase
MSDEQKFWGKYTPDEIWKYYLTEGNAGFDRVAPPLFRAIRRLESGLMKILPHDPRCVSCEAPFQGIGAPLMRAVGKDRSKINPSVCADCENIAHKYGARAEVPLAMLFADIRGSTALAESMRPTDFSALVSRFYSVTSDILTNTRGFVDKLIGDEASAFYVPGFAGPDYPNHALTAAKEILRATGHQGPGKPWAPVGIGIHAGISVVGAVGQAGGITDITALGDVPNTAARLASEAEAGEILISADLAKLAEVDTGKLAKKELALKGKSAPVAAWSYTLKEMKEIPA